MASGSGGGEKRDASTSQFEEETDYETLISTTDVELLKRAWSNEKAAPEILNFHSALVSRATEQIQLMEETVEDFRKDSADPLTISLYQMDIDRTQFLLRSYLRIRLQKIEKYMFHNIKDDRLWERLSESEKKFAQKCADNLGKHLQETVLSKLPDNYQSVLKQSVTSDEDDMVPQPQLESFVVCRSKGDLEPFMLEDSPKPFQMERDDLYFICYKSIKGLVETGKIDLV